MHHTELLPLARADADLLARLMQLYAYDFSEITGADLDESALFEVGDPERYWREPQYRPFMIRAAGALAGFAIVSERSRLWPEQPASDMAEFFVLRKYRRHGVGARAAALAFDHFPGRWEVRQIAANTAATAFWRAVVGSYTGGRFEELALDDARWRGPVQVFVAPGRARHA